MTGGIEDLENTIQYAIEDFERISGLEVTGIFRSFDKDAITVTLTRKKVVAEKVEDSTPGF